VSLFLSLFLSFSVSFKFVEICEFLLLSGSYSSFNNEKGSCSHTQIQEGERVLKGVCSGKEKECMTPLGTENETIGELIGNHVGTDGELTGNHVGTDGELIGN
jgi:hypothetical protein